MVEVKNNIIKEQYFSKDNTFFTVAKTNPKDLVEKEIGDSKVPDKFIPQQKITRWDNEVNVSIRLVQDEKTPTVRQDGDVIKWEGKKIDAHFYDVSNVPEGASEFEIILKEKPQTNIVEFTLNTKGVDFIYQPALTEEEIAEGTHRDENVVGSYAVYASEEKINRKGGTEYKCGKVGHIYRPKIIDSAGNETLGELNIDKDLLTVTIPQSFLDTAVYPVHHAAGLTFGYTSVGATYTSVSSDYIQGSHLMTPDSAGTLDSITMYLRGGTNTYAKGAFYNNLSTPEFLFSGSEVAISSTEGWFTSTMSSENITTTQYYICAGVDYAATTWRYYYDGVTSTSRFSASFTYPDFPASANISTSSREMSIYATYTAEEAGTNIEVTPTVQTTSISIISPTVTALMSATVTASVLVCGMALNTPTVTAQRAVEVTPTVQTATASLISPTVTAKKTVIISASTLTATASAISPTVTATRSATISAQSQTLACGIIEPVITALRTVTVSPECQELTITLNSPTARTPEKSLIIYGIAL